MSFVQKICVITSCTTDFLCEILRCKIKNSLRSCKKIRTFGRQATDMRPHILSGKQRVCPYKPQNFVLACLLGRKFSFDLFCRFARFVGGNKKAIVIKRLLFYLFSGLFFFKFSKRFFKATLVSVSISFSSDYRHWFLPVTLTFLPTNARYFISKC